VLSGVEAGLGSHRPRSGGRQTGREGEGLEGGGGGVAGPIFQASAQPQRPEFMKAGMQDAERGFVGAGDDDDYIFWNNMPVLPNEKSTCLAGTARVTYPKWEDTFWGVCSMLGIAKCRNCKP